MRVQGVESDDDVTSFIGRKREIAQVTELLSAARLVTLTGVGGVGKTRLAKRVAKGVQAQFPDGVWMVELARVSKPELLANVIVEELGIRDQSTLSPEAVLLKHLAAKRVLLVLDNCEHLLDSCATLIGNLLPATQHAVVLATSREPLGVLGEHTWPVPPLSMPDLANVAPTKGGYVYGHEALELLEQRARAVRPDFSLDSSSRSLAAELCQRLDGLPLAIELAAVRMRALSIQEIVERLTDRYRLLSSGNRGGPARHQTLRAAVDWSYNLCSEKERALWARLSVFAGSFDLNAAESVCANREITVEEIVEILAGLVEKSIVMREDSESGVRYRLLETIRSYGREQLAMMAEEDAVRQQHRDHYLRLAEWSEESWFGSQQIQWVDRLGREQANLWAALDYSLSTPGEAAVGLHMCGALFYYWAACGNLKEGRWWIDRALDAVPDRTPTRTKALWVNGWIAMTQGDNAAAMEYFDLCETLAVELSDQSALSYARQFRGSAEQFKGNLSEAKRLLADSVAFQRDVGTTNSLTLLGMAQLGFVLCLLGDPSAAIKLCSECLEICERHGEWWARSWALWVTGLARWTRGEYRDAADPLVGALESKHTLHDRLGMSASVELLAWIAVEGRYAKRAAMLFGACRTLWASVGSTLFGSASLIETHDQYEQRARCALGGTAFAQHNEEGAKLSVSEIVDLARAGPSAPTQLSSELPRLTKRESEVLNLIAKGMSNRDIAERLVISQRTVEGHVEKVLGKTGLKSRSQVAAWMASRGQTG